MTSGGIEVDRVMQDLLTDTERAALVTGAAIPDLKPVSINPEPFVAAVYSLDEARKRMTAPRRLDDMATWTVLERRLAHALHECGLDDDEIKAIVGKLPPGVCEIIHRCPECGVRVYPAGPAASRVCGDCG